MTPQYICKNIILYAMFNQFYLKKSTTLCHRIIKLFGREILSVINRRIFLACYWASPGTVIN